jgi:hypothetical protein
MPFNTQAMRIIVDNFNEVLEQERERHGIPIEHFEPLGADVHPVQLVASRMFSILAKPHTELCSDILTVIKGMSRRPHEKTYWQDFRVTHMAMLSEDKMNVVFFPNLPSGYLGKLENRSSLPHRYNGFRNIQNGKATLINENPFFPSFSTHVHSEIKEDLEDPIKSKRWLPVSRGITRLKKRQVTSVGRFLANYLIDVNTNKPIKDSEWLETVAERVVTKHQPPVIHRVDDIAGFRRMYTFTQGFSPSSCMDSKKQYCKLFTHDNYFDSDLTEAERFIVNPQAVDWYAENPDTFGVYAEKGGCVIARAVCYQKPNSDIKWSSRVYGTTSESRRHLLDELAKMGIKTNHKDSTPGTNRDKWSDLPDVTSFYVKALDHNEYGDCAPFPYFDWYPYESIHVKQMDDKFHFVCMNRYTDDKYKALKKDGYFQCRVDDTKGYVTHNQTTCNDYVDCNACGAELYLPDGYFMPDESLDNYYCHEDCAVDDGWYRYITGTASHWRARGVDSRTLFSLDRMCVFSNMNNALLHGHLQLDYPWALPELDTRTSFQNAFYYEDYIRHSNAKWSYPQGGRILVPIIHEGFCYLVKTTVRRTQIPSDGGVIKGAVKTFMANKSSLCDAVANLTTTNYGKPVAPAGNLMQADRVSHGLTMPSERLDVLSSLRNMPIVQGVDDIPIPEALVEHELMIDEMFPHGVVPPHSDADLREGVITQDKYFELIGIA